MNKKHIRVSIVIPVYNEERHLRGCLQAIARQTSVPFEVIAVDNNSTDGSVAIAHEFPFVRVVQARQQGIVYARNVGFDAATGDIIGRIDADTMLPPDWVVRVQRFFVEPQNQRKILTGGCRFYNLHTKWLSSFAYDFVVHRINRLYMGGYAPWGSNSALPREAWQAVRQHVCIRTDIHEDLDLGIHLHQAGYVITYKPGFRVGAVARRVVSDRGDLWRYLMMWPHTLRVHGFKLWPAGWLTAVGVWLGSQVLYIEERIVDLLTGRRSSQL